MRPLVALVVVAGLIGCHRQHALEPASDAAPRAASRRDASIIEDSAVDASIPDAEAPETLAQEAYVKSSDTAPGEAFGWVVAIDGDTLVVGAPNADGDARNSGVVNVFVRDGGSWSQQASLKASRPNVGAEFGRSVAISRDTIVVGSPKELGKAFNVHGDGRVERGAAYVFVRTGQVWTQQAYFKRLEPDHNNGTAEHFGSSVAVSEDTIVIGVPDESSNATGVDGDDTDRSAAASGAAFVFVRSGSSWEQRAYLKASNTAYFARFGTSVAAAGDRIVVGAPGESSFVSGVDGDDSVKTAGSSGAAYVFARSGEVWTQQAFLKASNPREPQDEASGAEFGRSVALSGDTVVVGAHCERSNARGIDGDQASASALCSGAAYAFAYDNGRWAQQAYLKASNTETLDRFGISVACWGDTIVVGATSESSDASGVDGDQANNRAPDSGAAYVFARRNLTWTQRAYLKPSQVHAGDQFGISVAVARDTLVVGAHFAVYVFR